MRSFALWCSTKNKESKATKEVTVHVNLWKKIESHEKDYCFDFGLLVEDIENIKDIFLYVPFPVEKKQIKDLGAIISNNQLVNAIFNENFTTTAGEPKKLIVNATSEKPQFIIYSLGVESQIELRKCTRSGKASTSGTILQINIGDIPRKTNEILKYYFRIRIQVATKDVYLINHEIKGISIFSNQFTNTEIIDFRLNDVRSCSEDLREQFDKGEKLDILAVHYLILRNASDEMIHYGKEINSRILERDLWKNYIDGTHHHIIAYHIKRKAEKQLDENNNSKMKYIDDFSDLTRFRYQKGTKFIVAMYVFGIIALGAVGGILGNFASKYLFGL